MCDFDQRYNIVDETTPPETLLSGHYKRSFAYYTLRDRLPVILTQIVDNLSKDKEAIVTEFGEESREEIKIIVGNLSKLKYELQTDKPLTTFLGDGNDIQFWNAFISNLSPESNTYYTTCWLYAECYMYRSIRDIFSLTNILKDYDYFRKQKENALTCCTTVLESVLQSIQKYDEAKYISSDCFKQLLKLNLWGNRCDLSISEGKEIKQTGDPFSLIDSLDIYVLIDDSQQILDYLSSVVKDNCVVDFVLDNSGYELFTDFLLANFLIEHKIASKVRFHSKQFPWYISDVTPNDFEWTIRYLGNHESKIISNFGKKLAQHLKDKKFELCDTDYFWTGPYEFYRMSQLKADLYNKLEKAQLVVFKGDLNYRKLIGDFNWKFTEKFETCLRGFLPTNICSLRTVKADIICGLREGIADALNQSEPTWMTTGKYGTIQFAIKNKI